MKIGKYEFESQEQAEKKIYALGEAHKHTIVKLGHILLKQGVYDEDLKEIEKPILSDKYHVDVLWRDIEEHPYGWKSYSVDLNDNGMHGFLGIDYLKNKISNNNDAIKPRR